VGQLIDLKASDGFTIKAYVATPTGKARGAMVIVQEIFGVNHHIKAVADLYAEKGYLSIAPAFFDRTQRGVDMGYTDAEIAKAREYVPKVNMDNVMLDVNAAVKHVAGAGKVGLVGYCWGGTVAFVAAAKAQGLSCSVSYYGGGVSANIDLQPKIPVMFHWGASDHGIPIESVRKVEAAHPTIPSYVYTPAGHGFNCDERGSWHYATAMLARERSLEFIAKHVG
jgi:carboxymethylenebutenolidase